MKNDPKRLRRAAKHCTRELLACFGRFNLARRIFSVTLHIFFLVRLNAAVKRLSIKLSLKNERRRRPHRAALTNKPPRRVLPFLKNRFSRTKTSFLSGHLSRCSRKCLRRSSSTRCGSQGGVYGALLRSAPRAGSRTVLLYSTPTTLSRFACPLRLCACLCVVLARCGKLKPTSAPHASAAREGSRVLCGHLFPSETSFAGLRRERTAGGSHDCESAADAFFAGLESSGEAICACMCARERHFWSKNGTAAENWRSSCPIRGTTSPFSLEMSPLLAFSLAYSRLE